METNYYFDNSATTRIYKEAYEKMMPYIYDEFANPSAIYRDSMNVRNAINESRKKIANTLSADKNEIYFTSGGTEADNWAIIGVARALHNKGKHIITSKIEHSAVLETCHCLEQLGFEITYLETDIKGRIDLTQLNNAIRSDTILVSIMTANNEIGTIQPIQEISKISHSKGVLFHTDAVQAYGHINLDSKKDEFDLLSASSHKFHGPKGAGFLYIKNGTPISPLIFGGSQENSMRSGTENTAAIIGMGYAAEKSFNEMKTAAKVLSEKRDYLLNKISDEIEGVVPTGDYSDRLPNHLSCCIEGIDGLVLVDQMSRSGISVATGSACHSRTVKMSSYVLKAIGISDELAKGALRLTLSEDNTKEDIDYCVKELRRLVDELRDWM